MSDVVTFLRARLDEQEEVARAVAEDSAGEQFVGDGDMGEDWRFPAITGSRRGSSMMITRPGYVLADVKAKRLLIERAAMLELDNDGFGSTAIAGDEILRALAMPYAEHSDYNEAWRLYSVADVLP